MAEIYHIWEPITDLPDDYLELSDPAFVALEKDWFQARKLIRTELFESFRENVSRKWAIETGQVEKLYALDDNLTKTMLENGLDSVELPHQNNGLGFMDTGQIIEDQYTVINSLYREITMSPYLTENSIRGLHSLFTKNQDYALGIDAFGRRARLPLLKGDYKRWPNSPHAKDGMIHQYCPPEQVAVEMERLLLMHKDHVGSSVPVDVEAAWLHHRFIQIHPFQDGNGRVARALASMEYIRSGFLPPVVTVACQPEYLDALDQANKGDLKAFVRHLSGLVKEKTLECVDFAKSAG
ncbi:MAG: Fic family protein [Deltaproteobacteria bacterium]|jgi:Fic family protein|nr:Fic family protein [Deltaproteobacteria bacterium]